MNVYEIVTNAIAERLESGEIPWRKPYHLRGLGCAISHSTKQPYSLLNQFLVEEPGEYWTMKQVNDIGLRIRKGSKSKKVVFWKVFEDKDDPTKTIPYLRYYSVFHRNCIEGLPEEQPDELDEQKNNEVIPDADAIIRKYFESNPNLEFEEFDKIPCYSPSKDKIYCPKKCQFDNISDYYETLFHEMIHSTGHKSRLDRGLENSTLIGGHTEYSKEELVAEIGSAYLCSICDLPQHDIGNQAAYIQAWLKHLRSNPTWIVWASSRAEKAVKYILGEADDSVDEIGGRTTDGAAMD